MLCPPPPLYCNRKECKQSYIFHSGQVEANAPIIFFFFPRQMGKMKNWLNGKGRRNNQAFIFWWLVVAHLLLLPSVKVSYADGAEPAMRVPVVSGQLVAAAQLQLTGDSWVVKLRLDRSLSVPFLFRASGKSHSQAGSAGGERNIPPNVSLVPTVGKNIARGTTDPMLTPLLKLP